MAQETETIYAGPDKEQFKDCVFGGLNRPLAVFGIGMSTLVSKITATIQIESVRVSITDEGGFFFSGTQKMRLVPDRKVTGYYDVMSNNGFIEYGTSQK